MRVEFAARPLILFSAVVSHRGGLSSMLPLHATVRVLVASAPPPVPDRPRPFAYANQRGIARPECAKGE
jgi:hypothetical protein